MITMLVMKMSIMKVVKHDEVGDVFDDGGGDVGGDDDDHDHDDADDDVADYDDDDGYDDDDEHDGPTNPEWNEKGACIGLCFCGGNSKHLLGGPQEGTKT